MTTAPQFTARLRPKRCHEGQSIRFNCSVSGLPEPSITWCRGNGSALLSTGRIHISNNYGLCSLELSRVRLEDAGLYIVRAVNTVGQVSCSATLDVEENKASASASTGRREKFIQNQLTSSLDRDWLALRVFKEPEQDTSAQKQGHNLTAELSCSLSQGEDQFGLKKMGSTKDEGVCDSVGSKDLSSWVTEGEAGGLEAVGQFEFKGRPLMTSAGEVDTQAGKEESLGREERCRFGGADGKEPLTQDSNEEVVFPRPPSSAPPMFSEKLTDLVVVSVGCEAAFHCILAASSSSPAVASITWYKDSQLVGESPNIRLGVEEGGLYSLTISSVQWADQGVYSIVATNCSGRSSCSATLTIATHLKPVSKKSKLQTEDATDEDHKRGTDRTTGQTTDQFTNRTTDQTVDQTTHQTTDRTMDQNLGDHDRANDQVKDGAVNHDQKTGDEHSEDDHDESADQITEGTESDYDQDTERITEDSNDDQDSEDIFSYCDQMSIEADDDQDTDQETEGSCISYHQGMDRVTENANDDQDVNKVIGDSDCDHDRNIGPIACRDHSQDTIHSTEEEIATHLDNESSSSTGIPTPFQDICLSTKVQISSPSGLNLDSLLECETSLLEIAKCEVTCEQEISSTPGSNQDSLKLEQYSWIECRTSLLDVRVEASSDPEILNSSGAVRDYSKLEQGSQSKRETSPLEVLRGKATCNNGEQENSSSSIAEQDSVIECETSLLEFMRNDSICDFVESDFCSSSNIKVDLPETQLLPVQKSCSHARPSFEEDCNEARTKVKDDVDVKSSEDNIIPVITKPNEKIGKRTRPNEEDYLSINSRLTEEDSTHIEVKDTRPCAEDNQNIEASDTKLCTENSQHIKYKDAEPQEMDSHNEVNNPGSEEEDIHNEINDTRPEERDSHNEVNNTRPEEESLNEVNDTRPEEKDSHNEVNNTRPEEESHNEVNDTRPKEDSHNEVNDTRPKEDSHNEVNDTRPEEKDSHNEVNNIRPEEKDSVQPRVVQHLVDISSMLSKYITMEYFSDGGAIAQALWFSNRKKKP